MSKAAPVKKKDEEVDTSPLLPINNLKQTRFNDEAKLKVGESLNWLTLSQYRFRRNDLERIRLLLLRDLSQVLKWNFITPRDEFVDLLKEQCTTAGFNQTLMTQMFSTDFKMHIKALDSLMEV
jgi:cytoskeleton-associated protein 5